MTLEEKLEQLNNDELIYIGSKSAFFFIGTVKDFKDNHKKLQSDWKKKFDNNLVASERRIKFHMAKKPAIDQKVVKMFRDLATGKIEEAVTPYDKLYEDWKSHLDGLERYRTISQKQVDKFKPFMKRKVVESYHRLDREDGVVIIIKGYESGAFWMLGDTKKKPSEVIVDSEDDLV